MTAGRWTKITGVETVPSPEIISGQIYCVVVYEIDLSQTNTPSEFNQGHFKTLTNTMAYPDITKEDLENGGTIYQFPFCQYVKNTSGISQFVDARAIFNIEEVWKAIAEQNLNYKEEFEAFFAEQKKEIDEIKEGLNETGNATVDSTGLVKPDGKTINVDDHGTISVDVLDSMEEVNANTDPGKPAGALAVKELSRDLPIVKSVTGSFPSAVNNWSSTVAYPEGFTKGNCIPVAIRSKQGGSSREYYNATGAQQTELTDSGVRVYLESAGNAYVNGQFTVYLLKQ